MSQQVVFVKAPARLHFGVLDLRGALGRWFGGIGAAATSPTLLISACRADTLEVSGEDADRAAEYAERVLTHFELEGGAHVSIHRALPAHSGLGSGTQLALAVARALAELYEVGTSTPTLARALGRGDRSAIGAYAFSGGGFVVEGGLRAGSKAIAPLLVRMPFPPAWRCVVAVPETVSGISGDAEREAIAQLPAPPEREVERVSHLVLMGLLPALADGDLASFGEALSAIQSITGRWFAPVQGDTFASGPSRELVRSMSEWGALGVGQSSWGPTVYGIVDGEDAGEQLAARVRRALGASGKVYAGPFGTDGARLWRGAPEGWT